MSRLATNWLIAALGILLGSLPQSSNAAVDERTRVALEVLSRLKESDLSANPTLQQTVLKVLEQVRGEPEFVDLVRDFRLPGREAELLQFALQQPTVPQAAEALRLILATPKAPGLEAALRGSLAKTLIELLGVTGDPRAAPWLQPLLTAAGSSLEIRQASAKSLAKTAEGANSLLALAKEGLLPPEVLTVAAKELRAARWPEIRASATLVFPADSPTRSGELPPVAELLQMTGDPEKGAAVFRRPDVACNTCHQVKGEGVDFGPKLSEIGSKLGKDAIIASILEPSAGISFGFEAWRIELKDGDELFGLVVSDAEEELAVKQPGGQVQRVKKAEVVTREKQPLSIMPAGLQQSLSAQEFVDLIAYLSSLKKLEPAK